MKPEEHDNMPAIKNISWWHQALRQHVADPVVLDREQVSSLGRNPP